MMTNSYLILKKKGTEQARSFRRSVFKRFIAFSSATFRCVVRLGFPTLQRYDFQYTDPGTEDAWSDVCVPQSVLHGSIDGVLSKPGYTDDIEPLGSRQQKAITELNTINWS